MGDDFWKDIDIDAIEQTHSQKNRSMPPPNTNPNPTQQPIRNNTTHLNLPSGAQGQGWLAPSNSSVGRYQQVNSAILCQQPQQPQQLSTSFGYQQLQKQVKQLQQQLEFQQQQNSLQQSKMMDKSSQVQQLQQQFESVSKERDLYQQQLAIQQAELRQSQAVRNTQQTQRVSEQNSTKKRNIDNIESTLQQYPQKVPKVCTSKQIPVQNVQNVPRKIRNIQRADQVFGYPAFLEEEEINTLNGARKIFANYPEIQVFTDSFNLSVQSILFNGDFRSMVINLIEFLSSDFQKNIWVLSSQESKSNLVRVVNTCIQVLSKMVKSFLKAREFIIGYKIQYRSINALNQLSSLNLEQNCEFIDEVFHILESARKSIELQIENGIIFQCQQENILILSCFEFLKFITATPLGTELLHSRQIHLELLDQLRLNCKFNVLALEKQHFSKFQDVDLVLDTTELVFNNSLQDLPSFIDTLFENFSLYKRLPKEFSRSDFVSKFLGVFRTVLEDQKERSFPCGRSYTCIIQNSIEAIDKFSLELCQKVDESGLSVVLQLLRLLLSVSKEKQGRMILRQTICYQEGLVETVYGIQYMFKQLVERGVEESRVSECHQIIIRICKVVAVDAIQSH